MKTQRLWGRAHSLLHLTPALGTAQLWEKEAEQRIRAREGGAYLGKIPLTGRRCLLGRQEEQEAWSCLRSVGKTPASPACLSFCTLKLCFPDPFRLCSHPLGLAGCAKTLTLALVTRTKAPLSRDLCIANTRAPRLPEAILPESRVVPGRLPTKVCPAGKPGWGEGRGPHRGEVAPLAPAPALRGGKAVFQNGQLAEGGLRRLQRPE